MALSSVLRKVQLPEALFPVLTILARASNEECPAPELPCQGTRTSCLSSYLQKQSHHQNKDVAIFLTLTSPPKPTREFPTRRHVVVGPELAIFVQ